MQVITSLMKKTLFLNCHDGLLRQTFEKVNINGALLTMNYPNSTGLYEDVLQVRFIRK